MASRRLTSRASSSLLTLLATGVLLTACMDDSTNGPASGASPSSVTPNATTASYLAGVRNSTTAPDGNGNTTTSAVLSIVDDVTGAEITTTAIDPYTEPKLAQAFTVSSDGKSYVAGRQTRAYYVYQHKLYEISLEHDSTVLSKPTARQVSSDTDVCEVRQVVEADGSAQANYLSYTTSGPDGDCTTLADNLTKSALSTTGETQTVAHIDVQRDSTGQAIRALGFNDAHKLVIVDTTKAVTLVVNGNVGASTTVSVFGKVAGTTDKVYLRVGADIRVLDWTSSTLSAAALGTLNLPQSPFVHTDDQATYYVDIAQNPADANKIDLGLWQITPGQAAAAQIAVLATTDISNGAMPAEVASHAMTPTSLALVVRSNGSDTLTVVKKADKSSRNISLSGAGALGIPAQSGEVLVVSQQAHAGDPTVALTRLDLASGDSQTPLSSSASLVTLIRSTSTTIGGEVPGSYLLWSDSSSVHSHKLADNTTLTIADTSTLAGWNGGALSASVSNLTVGLLRGTSSTAANTDTLWLFNATKAVPAK